MNESTKKKSDREIIKKINMAEHDMRVRILGMSEQGRENPDQDGHDNHPTGVRGVLAPAFKIK